METPSRDKAVPIDSLNSDQLQQLGKQLDRDMTRLQQSASVMQNLATQYNQSGSAVAELGALEDGQRMMVPLTESLYVQGNVYEKDNVLVDLGTGYFAERTCEQAVDFCKRKVESVKQQLDKIGEEMKSKENAQKNVLGLLNQRRRQAQQMQEESEGKPGSK